MDKRFWAIIVVIILIFGGILFFKGDNTGNDSNAKPTNHLLGDNAKGVTLVEYGDYQCPVCSTHHTALKQVVEKYKKDIHFQFRNLPLTQIHSNAFVAARAAEAADKQGKFWEMHDALYETQKSWSDATNAQGQFEAYARQLGLNVDKFKQDLASAPVNAAINADIAVFKKTGNSQATPTYFIDGKKVQISPTLEDFSRVIDAAIAKKK